MKRFSEFGLTAPVLESVAKMGFAEATPIQEKAISLILQGKDMVGQAQAGTGKTAAYGIPIAERTSAESSAVQAIVLCPTRELTEQVAEELHELCIGTGQKVLPLPAGQRRERQVAALEKGAQVVVGMPARVRDHLDRETLKADGVRFLVLDEGDMMVDLGQLAEIERILARCPDDAQLLLFSVTVPEQLSGLLERHLKDPARVSVVAETLSFDETEQIFYEVPERDKLNTLAALLDLEPDGGPTVVFCRTRRNVEKVTRKLQALGYEAVGLHSDQSATERERVAAVFREAGAGLLVTTDVAFRGLELGPVQRLINYHIPQDPAAYLVRVDRMGIAGRSGAAITLVTPAEYFDLMRIQESTTGQLEKRELPTKTGEEGPGVTSTEQDHPGARAASGSFGRGTSSVEVPAGQEDLVSDVLKRAGQGGKEGETEAERLQRRHVQKDVSKKISWTAHEIAMQEAWRIHRERMVHSVHEEALGIGRTAPEAPPGIAPEGPGEMEAVPWFRSVGLDEQRQEELEERIREAEMMVAESAARKGADLTAEEEGRILWALRVRDYALGLLDEAVGQAEPREAERASSAEPGGFDESRDLLAVVDHLAETHDLRTIGAVLLRRVAGSLGVIDDTQPGAWGSPPGAARPEVGCVANGSVLHDRGPAPGLSAGEGTGSVVAGHTDDMTRLFVSIGRRQKVTKDELERLLRETAGIQDGDIGRINLLRRYAFVEVRKAVAGRVVERMNEMLFRGREISVEPARPRCLEEGNGEEEVDGS